MRITLVYNPTAGEGLNEEELTQLLEDAGHQVRAVSRKGDWKKSLERPADLVVAAGGDGTICKVATVLADGNVPLAILPMGTANNIGKTLELTGDARPLIAAWDGREPAPFDLGRVNSHSGDALFVESFGGGAVASLVTDRDAIDDSAVLLGRVTDRSLHRFGVLLNEEPERPWKVMVDGQRYDGAYVAVEVLNIRFVGPNLPIAPGADPRDGRLDVVLIGQDERIALRAYVDGILHVAASQVPQLPSIRGREIKLEAPADVHLHLDDSAWPDDEPLEEPMSISVRVDAGALRVLA
jgi:diacylglycerol kinase (ATP)